MARFIGELVAVEWDDNDEPVEIALQTDDDRFLIGRNRQYDELLHYVGHEVEVEGRVEDEEPGDPVLWVRNFEVLELMTDDDYDDYRDEEDFPDSEW